MSIQKTTLPNGLRIVSESISDVKSISIGIWVRTGSRDESDAKAGITHFLEHMLFKGTERRTAFQIAQSMEAVGGYMNAFTSTEYTCYYCRCLDSQLELAVDVLSDMVQHSTFPDEEIVKEKKVVLEEMKMYKDSPEDVLFEAFGKSMFPDHPLGRPIIGFEETVSAFTREDLYSYIGERYHPSNLLVAVAGNVVHSQLVDLVAAAVTDLSARVVQDHAPVGAVEGDLAYTPFKETLTKAIEQTHMAIGRRGLPYEHKQRFPLLLANTVLSGGMSSRLHQNIREKHGYCYTVSTFNQSYADAGLFGVYIGTDLEYVDHVRELIRKEFDTLIEQPVPQQELAESKAQLKGKLLLAQESMSNRMMRLAKSEIYYGRFITLDELVSDIDMVTSEHVKEFSQDFFDYSVYSESLLIPENKA